MFKYLQRTGKALMLPIAALPIAGILLGIGGAFLGIAGMMMHQLFINQLQIQLITQIS